MVISAAGASGRGPVVIVIEGWADLKI